MDRTFRLSRGVINMETGIFPATLATNGEASDGHILDIRTLRVEDEMPMFANHDADPLTQLGIWQNPRKSGKSTRLGGAALKMDGRIHMDGDGVLGDIRRDVAQRIEVGDIKSMSIRWGSDAKATPRASLKSSHFAFSKVEGGWETPMFFENAPTMEASIVGLGSDKGAIAGRAMNLKVSEPVREFYRMLLLTGRAYEDVGLDEEETELEDEIRSQEIGDDWEEIQTSEGVCLFVPRDVAGVWGQSTDEIPDCNSSTGLLVMLRDPEKLTEDALAGRLEGVESECDPCVRWHDGPMTDDTCQKCGKDMPIGRGKMTDTNGREEPGHSGELLGTPVPTVEEQVRKAIAQIDALAEYESALVAATDAEIASGIAELHYAHRGTLT